MRFTVVMHPTTPQKYEGVLKLPAASVPHPKGEHLAATKAASPPLEPPAHLLPQRTLKSLGFQLFSKDFASLLPITFTFFGSNRFCVTPFD